MADARRFHGDDGKAMESAARMRRCQGIGGKPAAAARVAATRAAAHARHAPSRIDP